MILLDTGPLVALCDPHDGLHASTSRELHALAGETFGTCEAVLAEAHFHLGRAAQRQRLRVLIRDLRLAVLPDSKSSPLWPAVLDWLQRYEEHEPDWADACLTVLSATVPTARVWTFDREFHTIWKRPDGSTIPIVARSTSRRR